MTNFDYHSWLAQIYNWKCLLTSRSKLNSQAVLPWGNPMTILSLSPLQILTFIDFMPILLYFLELSSCLTWLNYDYPLSHLWLFRKIRHDFLWLEPDFPIKTFLKKIVKQGSMRLEPASMNFTGECANRSAMRNFTKCYS